MSSEPIFCDICGTTASEGHRITSIQDAEAHGLSRQGAVSDLEKPIKTSDIPRLYQVLPREALIVHHGTLYVPREYMKFYMWLALIWDVRIRNTYLRFAFIERDPITFLEIVRAWVNTVLLDAESLAISLTIMESFKQPTDFQEGLERVADLFDLPKFWTLEFWQVNE